MACRLDVLLVNRFQVMANGELQMLVLEARWLLKRQYYCVGFSYTCAGRILVALTCEEVLAVL
jgi:hypothetical protein